MTDTCPVCDWEWGADDNSACMRCGRPPLDAYDTGLDAVPDPIAPDLEADVGGPIRSTTRETEQRLAAAGYITSTIGVETVPRSGWQGHHAAITDTALFEYLLHDSLAAHLVNYREIHGFETTAALLEGGEAGELLVCPQKVANTWHWLSDQDPPTTPAQVRRRSLFFTAGNMSPDRDTRPDHPTPDSTSQAGLESFDQP